MIAVQRTHHVVIVVECIGKNKHEKAMKELKDSIHRCVTTSLAVSMGDGVRVLRIRAKGDSKIVWFYQKNKVCAFHKLCVHLEDNGPRAPAGPDEEPKIRVAYYQFEDKRFDNVVQLVDAWYQMWY